MSGFGVIAATVLILAASAAHTPGASPQLLSARNLAVPLPAVGNGNSVAPGASPDGRFVVFSSSANDLVTNGNSLFILNVFLRDRASRTTTLVSAKLGGTGGGSSNSIYGQVSADGRYVLFQSEASDLMPGDTNGVTDIFRRDLVTGTTELVSVGASGSSANSSSSDAVMTPDGRYVTFVSTASNLVSGDLNGTPDVFVRDLVSGTTTRASLITPGNSTATMSTPVITPDGRFVAFAIASNYLLTATLAGEVYVRDCVANQTIWASTNASALAYAILKTGSQPYPSYHPVMSDDGRFVAFKTGPATSVGAVVMQFDALTGLTTVVNTNGFPAWSQIDDVYGPEMTSDGRFIAYVQREGTGNTTYSSVHVWDAWTGVDVVVSVDAGGNPRPGTTSHTPVISPDGRYVAFLSNATNLVANAVSNGFHIYLSDLLAGTTQLVDADTNGIGSSDMEGSVPVLSADGQYVTFCALDGNLVASDNNKAYDVFVRDTVGGATELISQRSPVISSQTASGISSLGPFSVSGDGRYVTYASYADDLATNDFNGARDVFVADLVTGTNNLVSVGSDGNAAMGGFSANPVIGAGGRWVAFVSTATNLTGNPNNVYNNVFLRDLSAGTNVLVSVALDGSSPGNNDSIGPAVSQDGRFVAFLSRASNLGSSGVYLRDMIAGTNLYLTGSSYISGSGSISLDGRYVAYPISSGAWRVWDAQSGTYIYTTPLTTSAALSPDGRRLLYRYSTQIYAADVQGNSNLVSFPSTLPIQASSQWSADGRYFVFATASALVPGDSNGTNDVYVCDVLTGTLTPVSLNAGLTATANGPSDAPAMSGDGRFVVYRSLATDITPGLTNGLQNVFLFDRLTGTNRLVAAARPGSTWTTWLGRPSLNSTGSTVTFAGWSPGLAGGDLNRVSDVFAATSVPWTAVDSDGDGIPDWWMLQYFGHPTGQAGDRSLAQDDADGDGMTNWQEYAAGTDPTNPGSVFHLEIAPVLTPGSLLLYWQALSGRSYQVQYTDDLGSGIWLNAPGNASVVGNQGSFTVTADQPGRCYRLVMVY